MPLPRLVSDSVCRPQACIAFYQRPNSFTLCLRHLSPPHLPRHATTQRRRFTQTTRFLDWLAPAQRPTHKTHKGRAHVPTGGSTRGTTVSWGQWGLRLNSLGGRVSAKQLKTAEETLLRRLRVVGGGGAKANYKVYHRVNAGVAVYTKGNDQRMGKGKGGFDYWAARVARGRIVFEVRGDIHETVVKDALRRAGNKLPGQWEFVRKGDPPVLGNTVMRDGITREQMFRPRRESPLHPLHKLPDGRRAQDLHADVTSTVKTTPTPRASAEKAVQ